MKARLVQIGNSRGIRLPKAVLAEAHLEDEVELKAELGCIVIRSARRPRAGWADAAQKMRKRGEDRIGDPLVSNRFDDGEWDWRKPAGLVVGVAVLFYLIRLREMEI